VLDVGCGGGDASLTLVGAATHLTGVDRQREMLDAFAADAAARGVPHATVLGTWPDVAPAAGGADVVVCHHVLHNVVDLPPFLAALGAAVRDGGGGGVVVEMLPEHPTAWLDPLWERFHDLHRPAGATADDAVAVLTEELGTVPEVHRWERDRRLPHDAAWVARRLCLPADRIPEVAGALDGIAPRPTAVVTLAWTP
jgi:SAM-dependent methyltransferase